MIQRIILTLLVLAASFSSAHADKILCRVLDAETKDPIAEAIVKYDRTNGTTRWFDIATTDSLGYLVNVGARSNRGNIWQTTLTISFLGYTPETINFVQGDNPNDTLRLADVLLRPSPLMMREALVKGQARRFTMRGDTVVFHPEAFHLDEGERLTELIRQLPGVQMDESGALSWNGRPIRLRMNGEEGLHADLLKQLPVSAVKDLKAYEKLTELSERTGKDDGNGEQVLDITIKPGFLDKWYGDLKAKGYTTGNYLGDITAYRLSNDNPLMLLARVADDTEFIDTGGYGSRGFGGGSTEFCEQQYGALGYRHAWSPTFEGWKNRSSWDVTVNPTHHDKTTTKELQSETFIEGASSIRTESTTTNDNHTLAVPLVWSSFLNLSPKTTLSLGADGSYKHTDFRTDSESETIGVNTANSHQSLQDEGANGHLGATLSHYFKDGSISAGAHASYSQGTEQSEYTADYQYFNDEVSVPPARGARGVADYQTSHTPYSRLSTSLSFNYNQWLTPAFQLSAGYGLSYSYNARDEERQRDGVADLANSYSRHQRLTDNHANVTLTFSRGKWMVKPKFDFKFQHERMAYQRGKLDTLAVRNIVVPTPSLTLRYKTSKTSALRFETSYTTRQPDLISTLAYTDDTNALLVREGNPNLHASHALNASANYTFSLPRHQQMFSAIVTYSKTFDAIGSVSTYNPTTGAYRTHDENMRGGSLYRLSLSHDCVLWKHLRWTNALNLSTADAYGVLTMIEETTPSPSAAQSFPPVGGIEGGLSCQRSNSLDYRPTWTFDYQPLKLTLYGNFNYTGNRYETSEGSSPLSLGDQDLFRYSLRLNAEYKWRMFTFSLLPTFEGRKGYNSARMNRDRFILGADVMWKFLKGRASLDLRADDIFNNSDAIWSSESATQITKSWTKSLHHYLLLTFRLHFDAKAAKK